MKNKAISLLIVFVLIYSCFSVATAQNATDLDLEAQSGPSRAPATSLTAGNVYILGSPYNNRYLNANTSDLYAAHDALTYGLRQQWWLEESGITHYGYMSYYLHSLQYPGRVMSLETPTGDFSGNKIRTYGKTGGAFNSGQRFIIVYNGDTTFRIVPTNSFTQAVSINSANGRIETQTWLGSSTQKFYFNPHMRWQIDFKTMFAEYCVQTKTVAVNLPTSTHIADIRAAISSWNNNALTLIFESPLPAQNNIDVGNASLFNPDYARYEVTTSTGGHTTAFQITLYENNINAHLNSARVNGKELTAAQKTAAWRNIAAHELGHALGIDDNPTGKPSIMLHGRDRWATAVPYDTDITGVCVNHAIKATR